MIKLFELQNICIQNIPIIAFKLSL